MKMKKLKEIMNAREDRFNEIYWANALKYPKGKMAKTMIHANGILGQYILLYDVFGKPFFDKKSMKLRKMLDKARCDADDIFYNHFPNAEYSPFYSDFIHKLDYIFGRSKTYE